jgi:exopolysaccharide biosynthesis polyprenyl glycosylphosphotransferase
MLAVGSALAISGLVGGGDRLTWATLALPPLFVVVCKAAGLYDRDEHLLHKTTLEEVPTLFAIATLSALLLFLSDGLFIDGHLGRAQILGTWLLLFVLLICMRALARGIANRLTPPERCLLVGDPKLGAKLREHFALTHSVGAELIDVICEEAPAPGDAHGSNRANGTNGANGGPPSTSQSDFASASRYSEPRQYLESALMTQAIDRVILTTGTHLGRDDLLYIIREMKAYGIKVSVLPEASRVAGSSVEIDHLHGLTLLGVRKFEFTRSSRVIKRAFDVVGSAFLLIALAPVLAGIAIAIKLDSPGPVLFRQRRVGRHGRPFEMLKFRSMVDEADCLKEALEHLNEGAEGLFKISGDPRVTRIGRLLRRWQLDELPQLLNVLVGEMSLVGPRPLIPQEDHQIQGWYRRRLDVWPGITGHWQILGSSMRVSLEEMVKLDYLYAANWSLWGDLRLLLRTVPFVFGRGGL